MAAPAPVNLGEPLLSPPEDGISSLRFAPNSDLLLATSWDQDDNTAYTGALDGQLKRIGLQGREEAVIGSHAQAIQCVEFIKERGLVVTGSWDSTLRLWDPRAAPFQNCVAVINLPGKAYTMSVAATNLVVGTSGRHVLSYDVRRLEAGQPDQQRESSLKFQTRAIACYPDGHGYALGSVEGRVAMEYLDLNPESQSLKYAFKCHRRAEGGKDIVYPVHSIVFHPVYKTFATGGGDGVVNVWDGGNKKRLFQISKYPTSVSALAFNHNGSLLAVASSYGYERGEQDHPAEAIFIRAVAEAEVKPKLKK
ncbi:MAG: hypothetical protein WDW38_008347 [Sanguina aurantia]